MRIISWNINSVRLRLPLLRELVSRLAPDILCLQETKVADELFPLLEIQSLGFPYCAFRGQKSYNGVAILSRVPFRVHEPKACDLPNEMRHICVELENGVEIHNFYVPAGGDIPDIALNPKFDAKLRFLAAMELWMKAEKSEKPMILLGDLNIAPHPSDVWSHKQLLNVVSHTPIETDTLLRLQASLNWVDTVRRYVPLEEKIYSWWSYRGLNWEASDRGRRLDHIWCTPPVGSSLIASGILKEARGWQTPSDHVPVWADFNF
jgi:exodeoxyribonuclease-3